MMFFWGLRFFVFKLYESPKYLMGRGRDVQAVQVVHLVAESNQKTSNLTLDHLEAVGSFGEKGAPENANAWAAAKRKMGKFSGSHVKALFATRKLAYSTSLLIILWGVFFFPLRSRRLFTVLKSAFIGLAFPL